jgi:TetR/AcrR family transcriptional regulator, transcriptional repressor for nem operon
MPKAKETRAHIIEKTAPVFNKKGFAGTSLTDMEEATGLTKGSIYNNFANKDEVALAAFDFNLNKVNQLIKNEMSKHESVRDRLLVYATIYGDSMLKDFFPIGGCPILNAAVDSDDTHPELRKRAKAAVLNWKKKTVELIEQGVARKEFKPATPIEDTALMIIASIEGAIMIAKVTGNSDYMKSVLQSIKKIIQGL